MTSFVSGPSRRPRLGSADISHPPRGPVSVAADRGEQPRGRRAVAWLRLSVSSSQATTGEVAAPSRMEQSADVRCGRMQLVRWDSLRWLGQARLGCCIGRKPRHTMTSAISGRGAVVLASAPPTQDARCRLERSPCGLGRRSVGEREAALRSPRSGWRGGPEAGLLRAVSHRGALDVP